MRVCCECCCNIYNSKTWQINVILLIYLFLRESEGERILSGVHPHSAQSWIPEPEIMTGTEIESLTSIQPSHPRAPNKLEDILYWLSPLESNCLVSWSAVPSGKSEHLQKEEMPRQLTLPLTAIDCWGPNRNHYMVKSHHGDQKLL